MLGEKLSVPEKRAWLVLLLLALVLRVIALGERPLHHDESIHAWFSDRLAREAVYTYDPVYHGPVQYAMVAASLTLARSVPFVTVLQDLDLKQPGFDLGRADFFVRLPAALGGVLLAAMAVLLRGRFGPRVAFGAGVLTALSPNLLYYTRFCREDIWSLLGTAGMFLFFDRWFREKRLSDLAWSAFWAAIAFAAKENFYVLMALMAPSLLGYCWDPKEGPKLWRRAHRLLDFLEAHQLAIAGALFLFFIIGELLYTVLLVHPESGNPAKDAIVYWWGQHTKERVGGPKTYYLPRLLQYEFAILIPAFVRIGRRLTRLTPAERFLAAWGISSIGMYAYLGEKTPWLMVHQILPFIPLAAAAWVEVTEAMSMKALRLAGAAASVLTALSLCFWHPNLTPHVQKAESVIYVQTTPEVLEVVRDIRAAAAAGADPAAAIEGEAAWPFNWYVRRLPVQWQAPSADRKPAVAVVDTDKADAVAKTLGEGYLRQDIPLRSWWLPEMSLTSPRHPTPGELMTYLFTRTPWSVIGAQNVTVFRKVQ